jgi:hypothetical protein
LEKIMPDTVKVDLTSRFRPSFGRLIAEWWNEDSKCVVVRGSTMKDREDFALRLDLDKRAFLDRVGNDETDELLRTKAPEISRHVWEERVKQSGKQAAGAA